MEDLRAPPTERMPPVNGGGTPRWLFAAVLGAVAIVALVAVVAIIVSVGDDTTATDDTATTPPSSASTTSTSVDTSPSTTPSTQPTTTPTTQESTTTSSTTTTTTPTSSTSSSTPVTEPPAATAVWPWAESSIRYDDPVEAALGFATDLIGFDDPVAGEFMQGDSRSGEVEIRAVEDGPVTTIFVRQLAADDRWWVLGSATEDVTVEKPGALDAIDNPVTVSGQGQDFRGVVDVQVRADGRPTPLGRDTILTIGDEPLGSFETTIAWDTTDTPRGVLVAVTRSAVDGSVSGVVALRILLDGT